MLSPSVGKMGVELLLQAVYRMSPVAGSCNARWGLSSVHHAVRHDTGEDKTSNTPKRIPKDLAIIEKNATWKPVNADGYGERPPRLSLGKV